VKFPPKKESKSEMGKTTKRKKPDVWDPKRSKKKPNVWGDEIQISDDNLLLTYYKVF
jgi:hypothetical protein